MPVSPDVEVKGIEQLNKKFLRLQKRLDTDDSSSTVVQVMRRSVIRIQARMMYYPPQRPGSRYVRTGTLGRRWTTAITTEGDTLIGKVGNNTTYAPEVQSEMFQRPIFRGQWQTDAQVVREEYPVIRAEFRALVADVVREFGS